MFFMDRFAQWLWRRGGRQWALLGTLANLAVLTILTVVTVLVPSSIFGLGLGKTLAFLGVSIGLAEVILGVLLLLVVARGPLRAVSAWVQGDRSDPESALAGITALQRRAIPRGGVAALAFFAVYGGYVDHVFLHGGWAGYWVVMIGIVGVVLTSVIAMQIQWGVLTRPVREDIEARAPNSTSGRSGTRVAYRVGSMMGVGVWSGVFVGAAVAVHFRSHDGQFGSAAVTALALGTGLTLAVLMPLGSSLILHPVGELIDATRRITAGDYTRRVPVGSDDELGVLARSFNEMQLGLAERERLHTAFGSYVDPALTTRLLEQGDALFTGEDVEVTVFFVDVRDFTGYAEQVTAQEAVDRLNSLFELVVPILRRHGGHANKFLGDGVLAVFGVPEPDPHHAQRAVTAACEIQTAVHAAFGESLRVGIGINTGRVVAGTIGGGGKLEFTLIGDPVNVAARVEQLTKETGDPILITDTTRQALTSAGNLQPRGEFAIRGKTAHTPLYALTT